MFVTHKQKEEIEAIGRSHNLRFVILHGSYAKGVSRKGSDLDIAVLGRRRIDFDEWREIYDELGEIFGDYRDRELDVKSLHGVEHLFRYYVTHDGILLYGDSTEYAEYKAYAFRDFVDSEDLRRLEDKILRANQELLTRSYAR